MKRVIILIFLVFAIGTHCEEKKVFNINTFEVSPYSNEKGTGFDDLVVKEAFKRIGYGVNLIHIPATERAIENVEIGIDDGNYSRTKVVESIYKNIVRVDETINYWEAVVFSKKAKFKVEDWTSVNPYDLGYVRGWKILDQNIKNTKSLIMASDENNLFDLLVNDRVDVIIYEKYQGLELINKKQLKGIFILDKPLVNASMYLYLNKKYSDISVKLADAIKGMKKDGTYENIKKEKLEKLEKLNINKE